MKLVKAEIPMCPECGAEYSKYKYNHARCYKCGWSGWDCHWGYHDVVGEVADEMEPMLKSEIRGAVVRAVEISADTMRDWIRRLRGEK